MEDRNDPHLTEEELLRRRDEEARRRINQFWGIYLLAWIILAMLAWVYIIKDLF